MDLSIHFDALPQGMDLPALLRGLDDVLGDAGWLTGSGREASGGWVELELEDERLDPKHGILAVKHYLQQAQFSPATVTELAGVRVGIYE